MRQISGQHNCIRQPKLMDSRLQIEVIDRTHQIYTDLLSQAGRDLLFDADGHAYAMPNVGPWAATLYYNKAVFEQYGVEPPRNFDEIIEAVRIFRANDIIPIALYGQ